MRISIKEVACLGAAAAVLTAAALSSAGCDGAKGSSTARAMLEEYRKKHDEAVVESGQQSARIEELSQQNDELRAEVKSLTERLQVQQKALDRSVEKAKYTAEIALKETKIAELENDVARLTTEIAGLSLKDKTEPLQNELNELQQRVRSAARVMSQLAAVLLERSSYANALPLLQAAAELGSASPGLLFHVAYCQSSVGNHEAAVDSYKRAIGLIEEGEEAGGELLSKSYNNCGVALVKIEKFDEALDCYQKALELDEDYAAVHFNLALLYDKHLARTKEAIEAYKRHIILGGRRSIAAKTAIVQLQSKEPQEAANENERQ